MKYRIKYTDDKNYPYHVERKSHRFFFWKTVEIFQTPDQAKNFIRECILNKTPAIGTIIYEYSDEDMVVDKLKGTK
jgi:hypothetical protein